MDGAAYAHRNTGADTRALAEAQTCEDHGDTNVLVRALVQDDPDQASLRTGRPAVRAGGTPP